MVYKDSFFPPKETDLFVVLRLVRFWRAWNFNSTPRCVFMASCL